MTGSKLLRAPRPIGIARGGQAIAHGDVRVLSTLPESCVAACRWDPVARTGGMNHFPLPDDGGAIGISGCGANAMEPVISGLIRAGADRFRLHAKAFGGARVMPGQPAIGASNVEFAPAYLPRENIRCDADSLGGQLLPILAAIVLSTILAITVGALTFAAVARLTGSAE